MLLFRADMKASVVLCRIALALTPVGAMQGCGLVRFESLPNDDAGPTGPTADGGSADAARDVHGDAVPASDGGNGDASLTDASGDADASFTDATDDVESGPEDANADAVVDGGLPDVLVDAADAAADVADVVVGPPPDYCVEIPALAASPVVDGALDPGLALRTVTPTVWFGSGNAPAGHAMRYAVAWWRDGLYVFVSAEDPDRNPAEPTDLVWMGDSIEIYVDDDGMYAAAPTYDDPGTLQLVFGAPADDSTPATRTQTFRNSVLVGPVISSFMVVPTATGYDVEIFVTAQDLGLGTWTLAADATVGFDLGHNASVPPGAIGFEGNRDAQYFLKIREPMLNDGFDTPFANPAVFCQPTLLAP